MNDNLQGEAAVLTHEIIEAAKVSWRKDESLPFVQYLEIEARARCGTEWNFETTVRAGGVWGLNIESASAPHEIGRDIYGTPFI